jgi:hypothetical protein
MLSFPAKFQQFGLACVFTCLIVGTTGAQGLGYIPGGFRRQVQQASYPCPCERPGGAPLELPGETRRATPSEGEANDVPDPGENDAGIPADDYAPDVADLSGDAAVASADQSAAPNMIGDTIGYGGTGYISIGNGINNSIIPYAPGGGRKFKASTNQSPVPQDRFFYNFHLFEDALAAQGPVFTVPQDIDVVRNEFGWERTFWNCRASAQIQIPFSSSIDSTINNYSVDTGLGAPDFTETEIGNIALALKYMWWQTECDAFSVGLAVDLPTAHDVVIADVDGSVPTLTIENEAVTLSPFAGYVYQSSCRWFAQGFVQVALPVNENSYRTNGPDGDLGELNETSLFYADVGLGFWFYNSCYDGAGCGGCKGSCDSYGFAGMVELHYSGSLDDNGPVDLDDGGDTTFTYNEVDWLNLTLGLPAYYNCWSLTPAVVVPLRESPDRQFDVEYTVQVNVRY